MGMAGQDREPEPFTAGPAANGPIADAELIAQAQRLGQQHRAAGIAPFGDAGYVFWDEGSARLPGALGATSPATGDNARAAPMAAAYCDAPGPREAGDIEPGS
jgi:hypothetical protein